MEVDITTGGNIDHALDPKLFLAHEVDNFTEWDTKNESNTKCYCVYHYGC